MKKFIIVVIIIIVVILLCTKLPKKDVDTNTVNNVENEITNIVDTVENEVENEVENSLQNTTNEVDTSKVDENIVVSSKDVYDKDPDAAIASKKDEAIKLVREKWGEDDTVKIRFDSIADNGEYVIAVVSNQTKTVKNYFRVNLETKTVEVDY